MPKTCYCGLKSSKICKYALIIPLLAYICVKKHTQGGAWLLSIFFCNRNFQGGTGEFIYKASILGNKQLLTNMIDCEATSLPYTTRIAFLADSYMFCSNYPVILFIIAIASYSILLYKSSTFEQRLKVASYIDF